MTDTITNATGAIIPFPIDRIDREEIVVENPSAYFDTIVTFGDKRKVIASSALENADDIY